MRKSNPLPSQDDLRRLFKYDPATGLLFWKPRTEEQFSEGTGYHSKAGSCAQWNARFAGKEALTKVNKGYRCGSLNYQSVLAHRVIWKLMTNEEPDEVDHLDGQRSNNRWSNLRSVSTSDNRRNSALRSDSTTGQTGVYWNARKQKWFAVIYLGEFSSKDDAIAARKAAERKHGYHPNHGRAATYKEN